MSSQPDNAQSSDFSDLIDVNNPMIVSLKRFMNAYELSRVDKRTSTNILSDDYQYRKRFYVPNAGIPQLMQHLFQCYSEGAIMHFMETSPNSDSHEVGSGLLFEFVFIATEIDIPFEDVISGFLKILIEEILIKVLRMPKTGVETHYCILLGSPQSEYIEPLYKYKQTYRIIIPSIQVSRPVKKYIFDKLWNSPLLREMFKKKLNHSFRSAFRFNVRSIPNCFIGSCSARDRKSTLQLMSIQKATITDGTIYEGISTISNPGSFFKNIVYECSLNYEMSAREGGIIQKQVYLPKTGLVKLIESKANEPSEQLAVAYDQALVDIAELSVYEDVFDQFKKILDMLSDDRVCDKDQRKDIITALASNGSKYRCIALWFCKERCKLMTLEEFDTEWNAALNKKDICCNLKSLRYWAALDSPSEMRRFLEIQVRKMLLQDVKGPISGGFIGHANIATYLEFMFRNIFATTIVGKSNTVWYEFVTPSTTSQEIGQMYKWRKVGSHPVSLSEYISTDLGEITKKVILELSQEINTEQNEDRKKYLKGLKRQFLTSIKGIFNTPFKRNVIEATADKFSNPALIKQMDTTKHIMGVGNGVLEFDGPNVSLLDCYHTYPISMYSSTNYIEYDPDNRYVKAVYKALHSMFPDDEMDAFDFIMYYLSTSLDGMAKESLFLIINGQGSNGKSVLVEFLRAAIGDMYARNMPMSFITDQTRTKSASADPALMDLKNTRCVCYLESEQSEKANISTIKRLTGGDTVSGRQLYGEQENFKPNCNHLLATNYPLRIESTEYAVWRRFMIYKFKMTFKEDPNPDDKFERAKDPELIQKVKDDKRYHEAFLSILVHYRSQLYAKYNGRILKVPHPTIKHETNLYRQQEDIYERFIMQRVFYKDDGQTQALDEFMTIFRNYYRNENGERLKIKNEELKNILLNSSIQKYIRSNESGMYILRSLHTVDEGAPLRPGAVLYKEYLKSVDA